jgi:hypothetical protein|tara:strand:- start:1232 stop:1657 length:426 start_codon:yes stop_codon:yes gene_type:complete
MNDAYTTALFDVVKESSATRGYDLPEPIEAYVVMLLASHVEKPDFLPETFGTTFMQLKTSNQAKELGDTCLFVAGVFPSIGERKGLKRRYYQDIGSSSYEMVAGDRHPELFNTLALHFNFLSEFIEVTVHSSKHMQNILFR